jgi:uncharacterized protein
VRVTDITKMKRQSIVRLIGFIWLASALIGAVASQAQLAQAEQNTFAQVKANAEKGDSEAQLALGSMYASGAGAPKDPRKAVKWHRKAAEQGLARAQYQLSLDYVFGIGIKRDQVQAITWLRRAADQGLAKAQLELGICYADAHGVAQDDVEAAQWFRKAAEQGLPAAQYQLGNCYFEGTGVAIDIVEGLKWIRAGAEQGNPQAEYKLGLCYENGQGVPKDLVEAYKWLNLAAPQGDADSGDMKVSLAKVEALLTKEQVAEAQRLAREFRPGQKPQPPVQPDSAQVAKAGPPSSAADSSNGFVSLTANEDSEVFVDGGFVGSPPARLKLTPGAHVIEVKKSGCKDYRREITVTAGSDLNLRVALEKKSP